MGNKLHENEETKLLFAVHLPSLSVPGIYVEVTFLNNMVINASMKVEYF